MPPGIHYRHGRYYLVRRSVWHPLSTNREHALVIARTIVSPAAASHADLVRYVIRKVAVARGNSKQRRALGFDLTAEQVVTMMAAQRYRCAVTRTPFSLDRVGPHGDRPFAPSIDRVDNDRGYSDENCRLVCVATNFAINRWGDGVLRHLLHNMPHRGGFRQNLDELDSGG